jgi:hypothetical protein
MGLRSVGAVPAGLVAIPDHTSVYRGSHGDDIGWPGAANPSLYSSVEVSERKNIKNHSME